MDIENLRRELHEHIESFGTSDVRTINKSQELDKAIEVEQLKREVIYYMKRTVKAERLLNDIEGFCPILQRKEIQDFLRS
jgi:hypothetical protein